MWIAGDRSDETTATAQFPNVQSDNSMFFANAVMHLPLANTLAVICMMPWVFA